MSLKITQSQNLLVYICMFEISSQNKLLRITSCRILKEALRRVDYFLKNDFKLS